MRDDSKDNKNVLKNEILKINNLLKNRYSLPVNENIQKNFADIKKTAFLLSKLSQTQTNQIKNSIKNQQEEIKKLNNEKILLDRNRIYEDIINNQKLLVDDFKKNNDQLQSELTNEEKKFQKLNLVNRKYLINNEELKNKINRYIKHNKNLQSIIEGFRKYKKEVELEQFNILDYEKKIKFYQEDNTRLSNELFILQKKYEIIKNNFDLVEKDKNDIFKQVQELNNSLIKTNIVGTPYLKDKVEKKNINSYILNDISETNIENEKKLSKIDNDLDKKIKDIFKDTPRD